MCEGVHRFSEFLWKTSEQTCSMMAAKVSWQEGRWGHKTGKRRRASHGERGGDGGPCRIRKPARILLLQVGGLT